MGAGDRPCRLLVASATLSAVAVQPSGVTVSCPQETIVGPEVISRTGSMSADALRLTICSLAQKVMLFWHTVGQLGLGHGVTWLPPWKQRGGFELSWKVTRPCGAVRV